MEIFDEETEAIRAFEPTYDPRAPQLNRYKPYDPRAPQLNIPQGEIDYEYVNRAVRAHSQLQEMKAQQQKEKREAEINAAKMAGQLKFESLIKGGASYKEALRASAPDLFRDNPAAFVSAYKLTEMPAPPKIVTIDGVKFIEKGDGTHQFLPYQNNKPTVDPVHLVDKRLAEKEHDAALRAYEDAKKPIKDKKGKPTQDFTRIAETARRTRLAEGNLKALAQPKTGKGEPLPKTKAELKEGVEYETPRGLATWDGEKFVK